MRVIAPAKINLHLRVGPPRAGDGFHPLLSWMATVGLFDILDFTFVDQPGISLSCDDPSIPTDASNLVVKAASAMLSSPGASHNPDRGQVVTPNRGVRAALQKRIPVGAGLGGGSSDGASAALAMNALLGLNWPADRLAALASRFGSDLAFFFYGPSSVCTGRGEIVRPTPPPRPRSVLLIMPGLHMATPVVYRRFDEMALGDPETLAAAPDFEAWSTLPAEELLPRLVNDLEAPAFSISPQLAELRAAAEGVLGRTVRMSGSGSTLFTLFDSVDEARMAAMRVKADLETRAEAVELCPSV
jgi:4-diphosphocytidyl-2-C-methyl-D-erythritol kinase